MNGGWPAELRKARRCQSCMCSSIRAADAALNLAVASLGRFFAVTTCNLNDLEFHYDEADGIFRAVGWRAWLKSAD